MWNSAENTDSERRWHWEDTHAAIVTV
jgi:hypothetical protein